MNNRVCLRVWNDEIKPENDGERVLVGVDKPRRDSNGFAERREHLDPVRNGAAGFGIVCKAVDPKAEDVRKIATFDAAVLLRLGALTNESGRT